MRTVLISLLLVLCGVGCTRSVGDDELQATCEQRLGEHSRLTPVQANRFCSCFLKASARKVSNAQMADAFRTGGDDVFKNTLSAEFEQCQSTLQ
ncbi:hypothetical protein QLQ15_17350 [Lysobacter sp. LF1]|uniref:Lipoprotein n=1 Tax=Lysobacter stagni TaxID=3045172 RepID=A0ABT6XKI4_9GAMM|nr:hypothetical protein [Lysobacter sp. LF1]MDI9240673.1 hypothetical protein [Lysobacter sp. LF1]